MNEGSAADIHFDPARAVNGRFRRENGVVKSSSAGRARRSLFVASTAQFPTRVDRVCRAFSDTKRTASCCYTCTRRRISESILV